MILFKSQAANAVQLWYDMLQSPALGVGKVIAYWPQNSSYLFYATFAEAT